MLPMAIAKGAGVLVTVQRVLAGNREPKVAAKDGEVYGPPAPAPVKP